MPGSAKRIIKRTAIGLAALLLAGAGGWFGWSWWQDTRYLETTDDAYLQADYTTIAPKVSGYIAQVLVGDNEKVTAGQVLARIDDRDFKTALAQAQAEVATGEAAVESLDSQMALQKSAIAQAQAAVAATKAQLGFAEQQDARYRNLVKTGAGTAQRAEQAESNLRAAKADLARNQAALVGARQQVTVLKNKRREAETELERDRAAQNQAQLNLGYTTITAPIAGTVGARSLRVGQYVQAGTALMAVVPLHEVFVVANFKETELTHMRGGETAEVTVDAFPGVTIQGRVDSLAPASGQEFALLPPDNATGNFTKIVQRVPVKIALNPGSPLIGLLRPGMSVEASVDTKAVALADAARGARYAAGAGAPAREVARR